METSFLIVYVILGICFTYDLIEADRTRNIYRLLYVVIFFPFWLLWISCVLLTIFVVWLTKKS